ncbi:MULTISPECIES: GlxA family transcriptional regulator [Frankia]|uniref:AraC-family transcriptional regulator (Partial) n=1 Tax=Frankia alni (strain DSM 45986 / CECT 9034 / ACN14a) TaxID=326424 RepID=Q0RHC5_FRAAA|nr:MULTISPECIES: helix-turn-helix domain-containing protein [Frankia]CAJ63104.1 Putative AraC-family transcriptional regulator (partial) [Frankia alni ACN14a]
MRDADTVAVVFGQDMPIFEASIPTRVFGPVHPEVPAHTVLAVAAEPGPLTTSAGIVVDPPHGLDALDAAGTVIVPGWRVPGGAPAPEALLAALVAARDGGAVVAGLCLGAFVLGAAGLLDGRRVTTHWRFAARLAADHPRATVDADVLYVDEGDIVTSAGSAAGIDACLHLLRRARGSAAANAVARSLVVAPHRTGGQAQYIERPVPPVTQGNPVAAAIVFALDRLGDADLDVDAMARHVHLSRRTFDRRFRAHTGSSPLQWLLTQRVLWAQRLLESPGLSVDALARRVGFADAVALRPHFRRILGVAPAAYRATFADTRSPDGAGRTPVG